MLTAQKVWIAADGLPLERCTELARQTQGRVRGLKVHDLVDQHGPGVVSLLKTAHAKEVWVDYKLNDIPQTVAKRAAAIKASGADALTVMAAGGIEMMRAAVANGPANIYAVTVLTSQDEQQVLRMYGRSPLQQVLYFAGLAKDAGAHGIICSPQEVAVLFAQPDLQGLQFGTPGVRSVGQATHDQKRVDTPGNALRNGSSFLVVGRQFTEAKDILAAIDEMEEELQQALNSQQSA